MGMSDFDYLLRDCRTAFGTDAFVPGNPEPIPGRFRVDPFLVPLNPDAHGLRVTETWFFLDSIYDLPASVPLIKQGDRLLIRRTLYEVADIQVDDLGEYGLQLIKPKSQFVTWVDGAVPLVWVDGRNPVVWI